MIQGRRIHEYKLRSICWLFHSGNIRIPEATKLSELGNSTLFERRISREGDDCEELCAEEVHVQHGFSGEASKEVLYQQGMSDFVKRYSQITRSPKV